MIECTAVLMSGGISSRMGRDKAWLAMAGTPLWQVQLQKLRLFAKETLISARPGKFGEDIVDCPVVFDETPGLGPLGGLVSVLHKASFERVVILAVDMPGMTADYLAAITQNSTPECGIVPVWRGFYQGLAAVYPKRIAGLVQEVLAGDDHSLQHLNRFALDRRLMRAQAVTSDEEYLFQNWNHPADVSQP